MKTNPLIAYLDLNHLIGLAKDINNNQLAKITLLKTISKSKNIIFPISSGHLIELAAISNPAQRDFLAETIIALASNHVFLSFNEIPYYQVLNLISNHFLGKQIDLHDIVLRKGHLFLLGEYSLDFGDIPTEQVLSMKSVFEEELSKETILKLLTKTYHPKMINTSSDFQLIADTFQRERTIFKGKKYSSFDAFESEYLFENSKKAYLKLVWESIKFLKLDSSIIKSKQNDILLSADTIKQVPFYYLWSKLTTQLYFRNLNRPIKPNHIYDMLHLSVSLPYSDYAIIDKEMYDVCKQAQIDKTYPVVLFTSIEEFIDHFNE